MGTFSAEQTRLFFTYGLPTGGLGGAQAWQRFFRRHLDKNSVPSTAHSMGQEQALPAAGSLARRSSSPDPNALEALGLHAPQASALTHIRPLHFSSPLTVQDSFTTVI